MENEEQLTVRINLLLTPSEAEAIEDWRFANRAQSKSDAIRQLIKLGLQVKRESQ